jgi:hypothetical protein
MRAKIKKVPLIITCLILFSLIGSTQEVIKNSDNPKNPQAGRTITLREVMRIRDDGEKAVFKIPRHLTIKQDHSILFLDLVESSHLYKYDRNGQLVFKILKEGQGPEECQWASNFMLHESGIRVWAYNPPKVLDYDLDGHFLAEIKTQRRPGLYFFGSIDGKMYGIFDEIHTSDAIHQQGLIVTSFRLYEISEDLQKWKKIYDFPLEHYIRKGRWSRRAMFTVTAHKHFLFVVHTAEYRIAKFDVQKGRIDKIFSRSYERQKIADEKAEEDAFDTELRELRPPPFKYYFDILGLNIVKDTLWVTTSTPNLDDSRRLIDIFDMDGNFIDSCTLQFPSTNTNHFYGDMRISDDGFIYTVEQNKDDGLVSIGKYQINFFTVANSSAGSIGFSR